MDFPMYQLKIGSCACLINILKWLAVGADPGMWQGTAPVSERRLGGSGVK